MSHLIESVSIHHEHSLEEYARTAHLAAPVLELRQEAAGVVPQLGRRRVIHLNSTAQGGGVAEMLPRLVSMNVELGIETEWWTIQPKEPQFFELTKRLHNLIHDDDDPNLTAEDRQVYGRVSRELADALRQRLRPNDILVVHDPQPAGAGAILAASGQPSVWRCHIGLDQDTERTDAAWGFLQPHVQSYHHCVFTAPEYVPKFLSSTVSIIPPSIDPFTPKNRELSIQETAGILCNGGIEATPPKMVTPPYEHQAERMQADGQFGPVTAPEPLDLIHRPVVTQVSRWDRLKGWNGLFEGFCRLKREASETALGDDRHRRRLALTRLVLAGPDPQSVQDDPGATAVLQEMREKFRALEPDLQRDVALLSLPMQSRKHNALMVNALQRCSTVVVQNSLREGFGLTATEAMWKRSRVMGTYACGLRLQIRPGIDGKLVRNPDDDREVATVLNEMLSIPPHEDTYGVCAQRRVYEEYLVFRQLSRWLRVLSRLAAEHPS